ncbi:MAG: DJ-1/PfpI family protein [Pelatocladus maniniholoensis HA4357-MV3]|jgi:cyclohexyl-isocyanide hydratase|uniref:DJ-1/PfpI family protein n=1 Tax=Pelatocladus maniniholoensis HA4357-MV3 TaxID=1117104 RepID=A0A9E3LQU6_9NOST|nr:DJ-1/PfpI family protein [Pelatocladus maniniholoensis HA4357-MV3]BAZ70392.1 ThiJ family protein [Fischerella sp. NIES-4106]
MNNQFQKTIGLVIYPDMFQLDITAPHQVFSLMPNTSVLLLWKSLEPVVSNGGLTILPNTTFDECPQLDVLCVPGGSFGAVQIMEDIEVLAFLQKHGNTTKYITAVCTGSLILAAAGLLRGYQATSHWAFREQLELMGAKVSTERVVIDRNRITGGGVTAGIDFALTIAAMLCGEETAKLIELMLEYNPSPPFGVGSPEKAGAELVQAVKNFGISLIAASYDASRKATSKEN